MLDPAFWQAVWAARAGLLQALGVTVSASVLVILIGLTLGLVAGLAIGHTQMILGALVLAAVLAVLGYSVNESVVVFDRVRETFRRRRGLTVPEVINHAITSTISRTIITHGCTQLMVTTMLFFGGAVWVMKSESTNTVESPYVTGANTRHPCSCVSGRTPNTN